MSKTLKDRPIPRKEKESESVLRPKKVNKGSRNQFNQKLNTADFDEFDDLPTFEKM